MGPFAKPPAVVPAALRGGLVIDFFPRALADIGNDQRAGAAVSRIVETVPPRVAQAERPDLGKDVGTTGEWIAGRNRIAGRMLRTDRDVDPQHLAEECQRILGPVAWIAAGAAVAEADVKEAVRPEDQIAAVVVRERLLDVRQTARPDEIETRRRIGAKRIAGVPQESRDHGVP